MVLNKVENIDKFKCKLKKTTYSVMIYLNIKK